MAFRSTSEPDPASGPAPDSDPDSEVSFLGQTGYTFLENVSREMDSALGSILELADQIEERPADGEQLVGQLRERGERLRRTLRAMEALARLSRGQTELSPEVVDAVDLAEELLGDVEPSAREQGLTLTLEAPEPPVEVTTEVETLHRALRPLLETAVACTSEGEITVYVDAEDDGVEFRVQDPGLGIPEDPSSLFDAFEQRVPEEGARPKGIGLGLSLAEAFAESLGGTVEADSEPEGGSVFTLRIPGRLAGAEASEVDDSDGEEGTRLLIVEDNDVTQRLLRRMLEEDYGVDVAAEAREAIQKADENAYDAFVLDVNLKGRRTGIEVLHAVRKTEKYGSAPAVACTAYAMEAHQENFLQAGFDAVVSKPVTKRELLDVIDRMLEDPSSSETSELEVSLSGIELPPLPTTLVTIAGLPSSDPGEDDIETLTEALEQDQVVSQWLLQHINSAFYSMRESIGTVERAVRYLGFRPVCNLVLTRVIGESFSGTEVPGAGRVQEYVMKTSTLAAFISREVATEFDLDAPELAYTAGMFVQIGRLVLLESEGETYVDLWFEETDQESSFVGPPPQGQEILHCGEDYVQNGLAVGKSCSLSDELLSVLRGHPHPTKVREQYQPLVPIVALALEVAQLAGDLGDENPWGGKEALADTLRESRVAHHLADRRTASRKEVISEVVEVAGEAKEFAGRVLN